VSTKSLYRASAVLFVVFAVAHTVGFLTFTPPSQDGVSVRDAMERVQFTVAGSTFSYGAFYRGFGLSATVSMLFEAFLAWQLGWIAQLAPSAAVSVTWALCAVQVAGFALSYLYFSVPPAILSLGLAVLLAVAARRCRHPSSKVQVRNRAA
jgi:hypothetical protein